MSGVSMSFSQIAVQSMAFANSGEVYVQILFIAMKLARGSIKMGRKAPFLQARRLSFIEITP
jgi:hypothetical protein